MYNTCIYKKLVCMMLSRTLSTPFFWCSHAILLVRASVCVTYIYNI